MKNKKEKKTNLLSLCNLYLSFILQKSTIIILLIILIILGISLYFVSNPNFIISDYLKSKNDFHEAYFSLSIFIVQILNSIIIVSLCYNICIKSPSFDIIFISYNSRKKISIAKIIPSIFILFTLLLIEMIIIISIPLFFYPSFKISINLLLSFIYLYIIMLLEFFISITLTTLISIIFTPMAILFIEITIKILFNNIEAFKNNLKDFIPYLSYDKEFNLLKINSPVIIVLWIVLGMLLYIQIYSIKELKEK